MKYLQVTIETSREALEPLIAGLDTIGITGMEIEDPAEIRAMLQGRRATEWYDEGRLPEITAGPPRIRVYFDCGEAGRAGLEELRALVEDFRERFAGETDTGSLEIRTLIRDDSEWKDKWKEGFRPTKVGERVVVRPSWEDYRPAEGELVIDMDPGMAFGTGTHETTALSVRMLEKYVGPGCRVLDVGTGSGILAIAAARLGAAEVLGIDIDEDAVRVAGENIRRNGLDAGVRAVAGDLAAGVDFRADLIVANLLADLVLRLTPQAAAHLLPGGIYISSGILTEKKAAVERALTQSGFEVLEETAAGEWSCIAAALSVQSKGKSRTAEDTE